MVDLVGQEAGANLIFTVLIRGEGSDGTWHDHEIKSITANLSTNVFFSLQKSSHIVVQGRYTKKQILDAINGGPTFTVENVIGSKNPALPFRLPM